VGAYRLHEVLGKGAIGVVRRATRDSDGAVVALKILRDELAGDLVFRRRFEREAEIARTLEHPHLVAVVDTGEADGCLFMATRYLEAITLAARLEETGPLAAGDAVRIACDVAAGLEAMHAAGLVHRDAKPANVLLDAKGRAVLTDFGLARGEAHTVLTRTGRVSGTLDYLAPEIIQGGRATTASDIYALGCLAYESLAGEPPFVAEGPVALLLAHVRDAPPHLADRRPDLPEPLAWAVRRALAKDPNDRPQSALAFARLLRASAPG